ncbi:hypothetical protein Mal52_05540 [Symmachiella dynata]|uniref:Uncharacterized protein n=1 Tax=Symmachiella dynata TaxID=2527995 RepID=A0A517ZI26_9PLAN|nr:hypothetical protein Mal52_05540 [Symmachiella dynata]
MGRLYLEIGRVAIFSLTGKICRFFGRDSPCWEWGASLFSRHFYILSQLFSPLKRGHGLWGLIGSPCENAVVDAHDPIGNRRFRFVPRG